ncbi:MAG: SH3 domain-containing protein [Romboutsia sp.]|nr:SH3 domain-containing protein [Romboutsia sp.]
MNKRGIFVKNAIAFTLMTAPIVSSMNVNSVYAIDNNLYEVTVSVLNVRSGPSTSYGVISKLTKGTKIEVLEISNGWAKIKLNNGYGYCSKDYLKMISTNTNNLKELNMSVYLRKESNWSSEKTELISKGEKVNIISSTNDWAKVKYNSKEGYIPTQYLDDYSIGNDTSNNDQTTNRIIKITTENLNMRSGAGTSYSIITTIPKNKNVSVISSANGWDYVEYEGKKGYASNQYLKLTSTEPPITEEPETSKTNKIEFKVTNTNTTQSIDIISESELEYSYFYLDSPKRLVIDFIDCQLKQGNDISNTNINGSVIKLFRASYKNDNSTRLVVELEKDYDTKNTSISKKQNTISVNFAVNNQTTSPTEKNIYYTTPTSLNVRSGAGTSYSIIGKLTGGTAVNVISISNGWAKIEYNNGYGYCSESYLIKASSSETNDERINSVINLAKKQLGKPYKYGAEGPDSFDCSGFLYYIHKQAIGLILPRTSSDQSKFGVAVSKDNLKPGDLIFFDSDKNGTVNHAGMYIGDNQWIHSPKPGDVVKIAKMTDSYVTKYLVGIRRVIN